MAGVDALITDRMRSDVPLIPALGQHLISAGGKRLRPLLTVAAARLAGARDDACLKLAAAVEFIHTCDPAARRRGRWLRDHAPARQYIAAHLIWGRSSAVLVGDFLFARSFELMVETGSMRALAILAHASSVIAEGEVLQLTSSNDLTLPQATYLKIIEGKTAELFAAAAEVRRAVSAVQPTEAQIQVQALRTYGLNLGLAFQLVDDALDYGGATEALGKNAGDDFREGKVTLPLLLAVARTGDRESAFWTRVIIEPAGTDPGRRRLPPRPRTDRRHRRPAGDVLDLAGDSRRSRQAGPGGVRRPGDVEERRWKTSLPGLLGQPRRP